MTTPPELYAARLNIDYPERLDRLTTLFRVIWIIPIAIILSLLTGTGNETVGQRDRGKGDAEHGRGDLRRAVSRDAADDRVPAALSPLVVRLRRELTRFGARVGAYFALLADRYPSTVEEQSVHVEIDYPDVERDLNRWLPLVKWLLAIPHYIVLIFLWLAEIVVIVVCWFVILITGGYPRSLFDFVVGVGRWSLRVSAYAFLLVTDRYPPFSLR